MNTSTSWFMRAFSLLALATFTATSAPAARGGGLRILCSTFPIYQLTRNVVGDRPLASVELLLPAAMGCPHNYALRPQDMLRLGRADVLVVNGLGMEEFLGAPLAQANNRIKMIDSSKSLDGILPYTAAQTSSGKQASLGIARGDHKHAGSDEHHHGIHNPHLFASPRQAARIVSVIGDELARIDPEGAPVYSKNAAAYSAKLAALADEMSERVGMYKNKRILQPHGAFDYLARDLGLEIAGVTQPHGQEPSAAELLALVKLIRERRVGAVFTEPQYSSKVGEMLSRETGIAQVTVDPVASGPENAPLDYYESAMRKNLEVLDATLGQLP